MLTLGQRTHLKFGELSSLFSVCSITIAWLYPLNGFRFYFLSFENAHTHYNWTLEIPPQPVARPGYPLLSIKPRPKDRNISLLHIATLVDQHLQDPAKRWQPFSTTYRNIIGRNMFRTFGHTVVSCCDMLGFENRSSAHARVQHCYTNLAKRWRDRKSVV